MVDLAKRYGEPRAVLAYRACSDAIDMLAAKAAEICATSISAACAACTSPAGARTSGALRDRIRAAPQARFRDDMARARRHRGALSASRQPAAILSFGWPRCVDPYRLALRTSSTHAWRNAGAARARPQRRWRKSTATSARAVRRWKARKRRHRCARRAWCIAAGYETQPAGCSQRKVAKNRSSYAYVDRSRSSRAQLGGLATHDDVGVGTARISTCVVTGDGRLVVGGDGRQRSTCPSRRDRARRWQGCTTAQAEGSASCCGPIAS